MNTSILKLSIVSSPKTKYSDAQVLLEEFTGKKFSRNEAESVWANIVSHKWNMSEKLGRDVGFKVATIDFIENYYQSKSAKKGEESQILKKLKNFIRQYFEAKENITQ